MKKNKIAIGITALAKIRNFWTYFKDYLGLEKGDIFYELRDGTKQIIRAGSGDRYIFDEIFFYNLYNQKGFELKKEDLVVDIGAHIGIFSLHASKKCSKVYSFEPFKRNFEMLMKNIKFNNQKNIFPINMAVSGDSGKRDLFISKTRDCDHSFYFIEGAKDVTKDVVDTISLKDFFEKYNIERINFLKMDCEGGEYDILLNCPEEILNKIDKIVMEHHNIGKYKENVLIDLLEKNNFKVAKRPSDNPVLFGMVYASK